MATFQEIADKIETKIKNVESFKIGKTGQSIVDRYNQEYKDKYKNYEEICYSTEKKVVDDLEKFLIEKLQKYLHNKNEQIGGGEMTTSSRYIIYLMYNPKS